jgi:diguanylate cyclase
MKKDLHIQKAELLKHTDIFSSLIDAEIDLIAKSSDFDNYKKGSKVFLHGESGNALYIVESGEVVVQKQDESNQAIDIARFVPGNCFGELELFTERSRSASASITKLTKLLVFPKNGISFTDFLKEHPGVSSRILHKILVGIAERIRQANKLIKENSPIMQELKKQVYRDKLTGIYNNIWLAEKLREIINKKDSSFSLLILKPDNFKALNDSYGHDSGDKAIRIMARALRDFTGDNERVARYKGNAMAVFSVNSTKNEASMQASEIMEFVQNLDVSEAIGGKKFSLSASVGISFYPEHGTDAEDLLAQCHELPLIGRQRGGNCILFPEDIGEVQ